MSGKLIELNTWPNLIVKNLEAFRPNIYLLPDYGPIVETDYCWVYKDGKYYAVQEKATLEAKYFKTWKGVVVDIVVRFGNFKEKKP